ncbi:ParB/RepB/Spo0J family partition protein [Ruminococcus albus]|uniref:ParB/RepB/Spo0J family partition protein n=1 Tax=Ruminococcus albus TaxID=1264 RepID=UPI0006890F48|nr:ParB/RepB/Spo0J family partition protein [Ruminococcus albus]
MVVTKRSIMIPVDELQPHPDNPRKDVGDVTELADSIKANGIFQNLTILRDKDPETGKHTVIIGHRRLAAAKLAGLEEVPCMVVDMDEKEQISTMLLENMQRSDLTIYEQAQGFQMMLDMGETKADIAEKTGFSETTVRHRLKLLELDPEEFRKAEERQPKLTDYIELEKITDPELKSKALKTIGTSNFQWTMESCKRQQREKSLRDEWLEYIDKLFVKVEWDPDREVVKTIYFTKKMTDEDKAELDKLQDEDHDNVLDYWYKEGNTYCYILGKKRDKPLPKYEDENRRRLEQVQRVKEVEEQAGRLREAFVKAYTSKRRNYTYALRMMLDMGLDLVDTNWCRVSELLDIDVPDDDDEDEDHIIQESGDFISLCVTDPDKVMLAVTSSLVETGFYTSVHAWDGSHQRNEYLKRWYKWLGLMGYNISDEEKALLDGTHECFKEEK